MERIIVDSYTKGEKRIWGDDPQEAFNQKILAVNAMYGWLYDQGILKDVSFQFKDYSDVTFFALDIKDLTPYRGAMEAAGLENVALAVQHIFEEAYAPCNYSGAIDLTWPMFGYRDFDGTVSRSWECDLVKHLNAASVLDVEEIRKQRGIREAVGAVFEKSAFYPSDITKDGAVMAVRPLNEEHREIVNAMDEMSGNYIAQWLEDNDDYAWGVFVGDKLVGYCSIGYADDCGPEIEAHPGHTNDSLVINDVFVLPEYRHQGCGTYLVDEAIRRCTENNSQFVYLVVLDDRLANFYEQIGFSLLSNGAMVRDARSREDKELEKDFEEAFAYFSERDEDMLDEREYLFSHAEKLIDSFRKDIPLDLMDVDCWVQYESLLSDKLTREEYSAVNSVLDGDPHEIAEDELYAIAFLRNALQEYRETGDIADDHPVLSLWNGCIMSADGDVIEDYPPEETEDPSEREAEDEVPVPQQKTACGSITQAVSESTPASRKKVPLAEQIRSATNRTAGADVGPNGKNNDWGRW